MPISINQLDAAKPSLDQALEMVAEDGKITVLNAQEPLPGAARHYLPKDAIKIRDTDIRDTLKNFIGDALKCEVVLVSGRAGVAILDYADAHDVDCIVLASHRPELKDYLLGSTASRVVRHGVDSGWGRNRIISLFDHDFGHRYSPVSKICAHPSGEMCDRSSGAQSNPAFCLC